MSFDPQWQDEDEVQAALDDSVARLSASPDEEAMQERLNLLDHLLRHAPLVKPSAQFAERVIESIRRRSVEPFNRYTAIGIAMGFSSVVMFSLASLMLVLLLVLAILLNWTRFYQATILMIGVVGQAWQSAVTQSEPSSPLMLILSLGSVPLVGVWWWLLQRFTPSKTLD